MGHYPFQICLLTVEKKSFVLHLCNFWFSHYYCYSCWTLLSSYHKLHIHTNIIKAIINQPLHLLHNIFDNSHKINPVIALYPPSIYILNVIHSVLKSCYSFISLKLSICSYFNFFPCILSKFILLFLLDKFTHMFYVKPLHNG